MYHIKSRRGFIHSILDIRTNLSDVSSIIYCPLLLLSWYFFFQMQWHQNVEPACNMQIVFSNDAFKGKTIQKWFVKFKSGNRPRKNIPLRVGSPLLNSV